MKTSSVLFILTISLLVSYLAHSLAEPYKAMVLLGFIASAFMPQKYNIWYCSGVFFRKIDEVVNKQKEDL